MFHFPGSAPRRNVGILEVHSSGFPHSDISGSKVARHLPEAYRSHATSFIASESQGIHRTPLRFLAGNVNRTPQQFAHCGIRYIVCVLLCESAPHLQSARTEFDFFCFLPAHLRDCSDPNNNLQFRVMELSFQRSLRANKKPPSGGRAKRTNSELSRPHGAINCSTHRFAPVYAPRKFCQQACGRRAQPPKNPSAESPIPTP